MPSYRELTNFILGTKDLFPELLSRYQRVLEHLGLITEDLATMIATIAQEPVRDHFGFTGSPTELKHTSTTINVKPMILYDASTLLQEGKWYQLGLLFETDQVVVPHELMLEYLPAPTKAIWQVMCAFSQAFPKESIFLLADPMDLMLLKVLETQEENLWLFDLALIPLPLVPNFQPIPSHYSGQEFPEGLAVARSEVWQVLPWLADHTPL